MTYTRQQVLDHYNAVRGTSFTLVSLGTYLLNQTLMNEYRQMLYDDQQAAIDAAVAAL